MISRISEATKRLAGRVGVPYVRVPTAQVAYRRPFARDDRPRAALEGCIPVCPYSGRPGQSLSTLSLRASPVSLEILAFSAASGKIASNWLDKVVSKHLQ
jgi:hypothetical protein